MDGFEEMPCSVEYRYGSIVDAIPMLNAQMAWQGESSEQVEVLSIVLPMEQSTYVSVNTDHCSERQVLELENLLGFKNAAWAL